MIETLSLKDLYSKFRNKVSIPHQLSERLSPPLLLYPTERWKNAPVKVLIVGQETLGWDFEAGSYFDWPYPSICSFTDFLGVQNSVDALIYGYKAFEFSRYQPLNYRSPFWRAYRQIRRNFDDEVDGFKTAVLWTNLFRMSLDGGSVIKGGTAEEIKCICQATQGLLRSEIEILKPDVTLFFTGPDYNETLYSEFLDMQLHDFNGYDISRTAWIEHPALPAISLRSYHPGYLNRGHWELVDKIEQEVVARATHNIAASVDGEKARRP